MDTPDGEDPMATRALHHYTPDEYLARERGAPFKSEYRDGHIFAMVGTTSRHNLITGNVHALLWTTFRGGPCRAFVADLRVRIERGNHYVYPDVAALCEEPRFQDGVLDTLMNPALVVEVLSESTEAYDRGEKFAAYRQIETLREYVLIAQDRVAVDRYRRNGDLWTLTSFDSVDGVLELDSVGAPLPLAEIYEGVELG
jgi:Uma2 family endonuclease